MENGYYWISKKNEVSEIAFYDEKTKLFYRIGTGYGLSIKEVEVYNRVDGQNDSTSERDLHISDVVESDNQKLEELTEHNTNVVSQFMYHCEKEGYDLPDRLFESFFDA